MLFDQFLLCLPPFPPFPQTPDARKPVDLNQAPHVIYQVHQPNLRRCTGPACSRQANHAEIQAPLLMSHRTKGMFNPNSYLLLPRRI